MGNSSFLNSPTGSRPHRLKGFAEGTKNELHPLALSGKFLVYESVFSALRKLSYKTEWNRDYSPLSEAKVQVTDRGVFLLFTEVIKWTTDLKSK